jgi:hypothetical protein
MQRARVHPIHVTKSPTVVLTFGTVTENYMDATPVVSRNLQFAPSSIGKR